MNDYDKELADHKLERSNLKLALKKLKEKARIARSEVDALEKIISERMGPLPLPSSGLRLHVGMNDKASKFLRHGYSSSRKVLSVFGENPQGPVLDWGCGSGRTLRWLMQYEAWGEHYHGTDVDHEAIAWLKNQGVNNVAVCSERLPFDDNVFAGVFSFSVLTHIHPLQFRPWLEEVARVLKPGSLAYLTFNGECIHDSKKPYQQAAVSEYLEKGWVWRESPGHYKSAAFANHEFVREQIDGLFKVKKIVACDYHKMDALFAEKLA